MNDVLHYYELKQKYQENFDIQKNKVRKKKGVSINEKRLLIKALHRKCVNCGKPGGTIFDESNGLLKAICGSKTPCDLNINIKRKLYDNMRDIELSSEKKMENLKMRIIMTKLDYLFGINNSKEEIVDRFNKLKMELAGAAETQLIHHRKYADIISGIHREPLLKDAQADLENEIGELKQIYAEYLAKPTQAYITTMIERYTSTILPLVEQIRDMKYGYYQMERIVGTLTHKLVADPYRFDQLEQERK